MRLGQGFDAGQSNPRFGDRFSTPSGFSGAPATPNQFSNGGGSGVTGGRSPSSALRGRPNFSGGSTSSTLRPAAPLRGGPNPGNPGFVPDAVMDSRLFGDSSAGNGALNNFRLPIRVPIAPAVPNVGESQERPLAPSVTAAPVPQTAAAPQLPLPAVAQSSEAAKTRASVQATAVVPMFEPQGVATATAFPARERALEAASAAAPRRTTFRSQADFVEIPAGGGGPHTTGYRGAMNTTTGANDVVSVFPGYTLWQGYYWYHSPRGGWHYWDGSHWTRF
jgi:hypothetical protein